jgi:hypothetical protein
MNNVGRVTTFDNFVGLLVDGDVKVVNRGFV